MGYFLLFILQPFIFENLIIFYFLDISFFCISFFYISFFCISFFYISFFTFHFFAFHFSFFDNSFFDILFFDISTQTHLRCQTNWPVDYVEEEKDERKCDQQSPVQMIQLKTVPKVFLGNSVDVKISLEEKKMLPLSINI